MCSLARSEGSTAPKAARRSARDAIYPIEPSALAHNVDPNYRKGEGGNIPPLPSLSISVSGIEKANMFAVKP